MQNFQELSDQELETVVGGHGGHHHSPSNAGGSQTTAQVIVQATANGGILHFDTAYGKTETISITSHGESASAAIGFALSIAI